MNLILIILPLIAVVITGFTLARMRYFKLTTIQDVAKFTFNILLPLYLFHRIAIADLSEGLEFGVFVSFYGAVLSCYLVTFLLSRYSSSMQSKPAIFSLGANYSNTIIVGLPALVLTVGEHVAAIVFLIISVHSAMLFFLTSVLAVIGKKAQFKLKPFVRSTLLNPLLIGISLGLVVNFVNISFPKWLSDSFTLMTQPALPLALLILGANLHQYTLRSAYFEVFCAAMIKLLILPFVTFLLAQYYFQLSSELVMILVILTACPTGVNAYLVAAGHQNGQAVVAGSVVVTTMLSAITIPFWLSILS